MANDNPVTTENKSWKLFALAAVFAVLAGLGTILYLKVMENRLKAKLTPKKEATTAVVVSARDLKVGTVIGTDTMAVRHVPSEYVDIDVITPDNFDSVSGGTLIKPLPHGKMLMREFIDLNLPKDFSGTIKKGHRAMTIQVDEVNSISGLIRPGNFIDLYLKMSTSVIPAYSQKAGKFSKDRDLVIPVLEDVLVLATDHAAARPNEDEYRNYDPNAGNRAYNTLTLEVTPKEASLLAIAESTGMMVATLRNPDDTDGTLFGEVTTSDLLRNSQELLLSTISKHHNRSLDGVHYDKDGRLVTRDGTPLKDQSLRLNAKGLIETRDGKVLSGRDLVVGPDGEIRTKNGDVVDTDSLVAGKGGTLVDKNGTVLSTNGYKSLKGGFLQDADGNVLTPDGHIIAGVKVDSDGTVRAQDGKALNAGDLIVDKDGTVHLRAGRTAVDGVHVDNEGRIVNSVGEPVSAADLTTVSPDGTVRSNDGKVLQGVRMGKDGKLYSADGRAMSPADVVAAEQGMHLDPQGNLVDKNGNIVHAADLVTVDKDGTVRTRDGKVLKGMYVDKDGKLRRKDGSLVSAADVLRQEEINSLQGAPKQEQLAGITSRPADDFVANIMGKDEAPEEAPITRFTRYEVEYIVGGTSKDGTANTFRVLVDESVMPGEKQQ